MKFKKSLYILIQLGKLTHREGTRNTHSSSLLLQLCLLVSTAPQTHTNGNINMHKCTLTSIYTIPFTEGDKQTHTHFKNAPVHRYTHTKAQMRTQALKYTNTS